MVDHPLVDRCYHQVQQDKQRQEQCHYQCQYWAVEEHYQKAHQGKDHVQHDGQGASGHKVTQVLHFTHAGYHITDLPPGKVGQGQCRNIAEEAAGKGHIHLGGDIGKEIASKSPQPTAEHGCQQHAKYKYIQCISTPVHQYPVNDDLDEERGSQSKKLQNQGQPQNGAKVFAVLDNYRQEPAEAEFLSLASWQLIAAGKEDNLSQPVLANDIHIGSLNGFSCHGIGNEHLAIPKAMEDDVASSLHGEYGRAWYILQLLKASLAGPDLQLQVPACPDQSGGVHAALLQHIGTLQLTHVRCYLVVLGYEYQTGQACIYLGHIISPSVLR